MSSSVIESLSEHNQARVATILESCLFALEHGERLSPEELIEAHPDLAEPLGKCLTTLMTLHAAVHGEAAPTEADMPEPGVRLGDFILEEQIGRGGMGVVYRAKQISLDRLVAIKLLANSHLLSPTQLQRFNLESRAAAQLRHDNIVPVIAVGQEKNIHYFAMQLINGCSLEKVDYRTWSQNGCRAAMEMAIDLSDALAHAHACGVIHRDLKPSNLLLDAQGKVWIGDFGLAMCKGDTRLTMSGDLVGTMNYMSPEQSQSKPVDERTDIYSLGVTLYELVTGKAAFPGGNRADVFRAIENDDPIAPRKLNTQCPYDLETILLKAMAKGRDERYASAGAMRDDLQRVLDGKPIEGRRPAIWQRVWRKVQRHRALVTVAAVGLLATCSAVTIGAAQVLLTQRQLNKSRIESQSHLALADTNYWQGRNLVQRWNKEVIQKLAELPGAETLHAGMLADTIDYYQAFLEKARSQLSEETLQPGTVDPTLAKDMAAARLGLAGALDAQGESAEAIKNYRLAIDELETLSQSDSTVSIRLAIAQNDLAVVLLLDGQAEQSRSILNAARHRLEQSEEESSDIQAAIEANLARTYQALGDKPAQAAALRQAELEYRRAIREKTDGPERSALESELAAVLDYRVLMLADSDRDEAQSLSRQALELHRTVCNQPFAAVNWLRRLAASQHNYGVLSLETGQVETARRAFKEAIHTKLTVGKRTGLRKGTGSDVALTYLALGRLESQQDQTESAREFFREAQSAIRHDLAIHPTVENQLLLAESLASHWRLSKEESVRLELTQLLSEVKPSSLTEAQQKIVYKLGSLAEPKNTDAIEPVPPSQALRTQPSASPSDAPELQSSNRPLENE